MKEVFLLRGCVAWSSLRWFGLSRLISWLWPPCKFLKSKIVICRLGMLLDKSVCITDRWWWKLPNHLHDGKLFHILSWWTRKSIIQYFQLSHSSIISSFLLRITPWHWIFKAGQIRSILIISNFKIFKFHICSILHRTLLHSFSLTINLHRTTLLGWNNQISRHIIIISKLILSRVH